MEKNSKQMEAKRIYQKFVPFEFQTFKYVDHYKHNREGHVCIINNERFVRSGDIYGVTDAVRRFISIGYITRDDALPGKQMGDERTFTGRPCMLLKLSALKKLKQEFLESSHFADPNEFESYIKGAEEAEGLPYSDFTPAKIKEIWENYDERQRLITEGTRERKAEKEQEEREEWERRNGIEQKPSQDELADLVDRIEALGWHVTLTRKEGA